MPTAPHVAGQLSREGGPDFDARESPRRLYRWLPVAETAISWPAHTGVQRVRGDADLERQNGRFKVFIVPPTV